MKKLTLLLLLGGLLLIASPSPAQSDYNNLSTSRSKAPPHVGMTREEVRRRYGAPFNRTILRNGERWLYRLKFDEVYGRAYVPFYISSDNIRLGTIDFGPDGRAKTFVWERTVSRQVN